MERTGTLQTEEPLINAHISHGNQGGHLMQWASRFQARPFSINTISSEMNSEDKCISKDIISALEQTYNTDINEVLKYNVESSTSLNDTNIAIKKKYDFYTSICERIWRCNDQKSSLFLQDKLKNKCDGDFEVLISIVDEQAEALMIHRFGNFLVQRRLEVSNEEDVSQFAKRFCGRIATLSKNQFCCHVIQKLLDMSPLFIQAKIMAEMLDNSVETMTSPFGTHVWQKLFYLEWPPNLPPIVTIVNNAIHINNKEGWTSVLLSEPGCATIKSYLGIAVTGSERQDCIEAILGNITRVIELYNGFALVSKVILGTSTRGRAITKLCENISDLATHPVASSNLILLLNMKIPSFPSRLVSAITPYSRMLADDTYGEQLLKVLGIKPSP